MSSKPPSRVVFVGNIPYDLSEEQITEIFKTAGTVVNFRLVYDRETGRPKGFGFAEYLDADSAGSAVRNLNDYEIMNRKLRVDYSSEGRVEQEDDKGQAHTGAAGHGQSQNGNSYAAAQAPPGSSLPPLPAGKELPPGVSFSDQISRTLQTLPPSQLLDILGQMQTLVSSDPARATELLTQAPQLGYAIMQALLLMGLVLPDAIPSVADAGAAMPVQAPVAGYAPSSMPSYSTATPPVNNPYAPPPSQTFAPPTAPTVAPVQDPEQLIRQVMELSQEDLNKLSDQDRQQVMMLRMQFMGAGR